MAEAGKAQNTLGQLFVDFTAKGLPSLLKNLNSVSASFLLGKNAASQFVQTINKPIKEVGQGAVEVGKLAASFGATKREIMQLQIYLKNHNLSEALIGDLGSVSDMLTKVKMGIGGISGEFAYAMQRMGLNWTDYDGSLESMTRLANDVKNATQGMNPQQAKVLREAVGLKNQDWAYAFERSDFNMGDYKTISDKEVDDLISTQESMANLSASLSQLTGHLVSKLSPAIIRISDWIAKWAGEGATGNLDNPDTQMKERIDKGVSKNAGKIGIGATLLGHPLVGATVVGASNIANMERSVGSSTGHIVPTQFGAAPLDFGTAPWIKNKKGSTTGGAAPIAPDFMTAPEALAPSNTSNLTQNNTIQITNQNTINGTNANAVKDRIVSINENDISYSQYQVSNMAGL